MPFSRLQLNPETNFPSINSFADVSQFLRGVASDEDCRRISGSMGEMAAQIEAIITRLRAGRAHEGVAAMLVDLLSFLRTHRQIVVNLDPGWRGLYEYASYLQALNNFRVLIGEWLLEGSQASRQLSVTAEDFELAAWRTLGEGLLMIDVYEQMIAQDASPQESDGGDTDAPRVQRALQWLKKLRL